MQKMWHFIKIPIPSSRTLITGKILNYTLLKTLKIISNNKLNNVAKREPIEPAGYRSRVIKSVEWLRAVKTVWTGHVRHRMVHWSVSLAMFSHIWTVYTDHASKLAGLAGLAQCKRHWSHQQSYAMSSPVSTGFGGSTIPVFFRPLILAILQGSV